MIAVARCARRTAHEVDVEANFRRGIGLRSRDRPVVADVKWT